MAKYMIIIAIIAIIQVFIIMKLALRINELKWEKHLHEMSEDYYRRLYEENRVDNGQGNTSRNRHD